MKKKDVLKYFKTGVKVAEALNIEPSAVYQWGEEIPRLRAFEIERITNGALKADSKPSKKSA